MTVCKKPGCLCPINDDEACCPDCLTPNPNYKSDNVPVKNINEKDIYLKAINTFGANQQIIKAMEELGELSTALARYFTKSKSNTANINEEIADVEIMLSQLRLIFSNAEIDHHKKAKLERLKGVVW